MRERGEGESLGEGRSKGLGVPFYRGRGEEERVSGRRRGG
jgi:hypothetical protein